VQVHYGERVAIHTGPEPCVVVREDGSEASAGERIGQPLSRESARVSGADARCLVQTKFDGRGGVGRKLGTLPCEETH